MNTIANVAEAKRAGPGGYLSDEDFQKLVLQEGHYSLLAGAFAMLFPDTPAARMLADRAQLMALHSAPLPNPTRDATAQGDTKEFWERIDELERPYRSGGADAIGLVVKAIFYMEWQLGESHGQDTAIYDLARGFVALASARMAGGTVTPIAGGTAKAA